MIIYRTASLPHDLQGIHELQKANLPANLSLEEMQREGFVTVSHSLEQLAELNEMEQHVVAIHNERVIGYLLAMPPAARSAVPALLPMFEMFDETSVNGKPIGDATFMVVGQVCIDRAFRGRGVLESCYAFYRKRYEVQYDFAITEIAKANTRSLAAHKRIGFREVRMYNAPDGIEWIIVIWDWHAQVS